MKIRKAFKHALSMVLHSKLRSWLTILGIVIGVGAVIAIVSLGQSLQTELTSQLGALGGDLLTLRAGGSRAQGFGGGPPEADFGGGGSASTTDIVIDKTDIQVLKGIEQIKVIDTEISGRVDIYYIAEKGSASITGVDPASWSQISTTNIRDGRTLGPADTNVIVVGGRIADSFFKTKLGVNQVLTIDNKLFRIVGVLDDTSTSIYMPINQAYDVIPDKIKDDYDTVIIKIKDESLLDATMQTISGKLMLKRHAPNNKLDFTLTSNKERQQQRAQIMGSMTIFLTAIAAVALLVGAVGIANSMFTSVLEKTKEIGIMKAIGARNHDILMIFLLNAGLIGFFGGVIGVVFGIILSGFMPMIMGSSTGFLRLGSGSVISITSMLIAIFGSILIGMVSGAVPAYQASRLKPVDALRYE